MEGEFNPSKNKKISVFEYSEKSEIVPLQKQIRIQNTVHNKNLKSSIDFNHPLGDEKKYAKKNKDFYSYNEFLKKDDLQFTSNKPRCDINPIKIDTTKKNFNTLKSKSINLNFGNETNPITNPNSEKNIFKVGLRDKKDKSTNSNQTYITSESSIFSTKNKAPCEVSFKQFSMGKITNQSIGSVNEKTQSTNIPIPKTSFAHYKDPFSQRTFYRES